MNQNAEAIDVAELDENAPKEARGEKPFRMPPPRIGQIVSWYPHAVTSGRPHNAIVYTTNSNTVGLMSLELGKLGMDLGEVHHAGDPFLLTNDYVRRNFGGWDFTPNDKHLERQAKLQAERMAAIERRLASLEGKKTK